MELQFNGLTLDIEIESYTPERPAPFAQTPDCPGYDDEGDAEECEYKILSVKIDCHETYLEFLDKCLEGYGKFDEELCSDICEKIREEQE